MKGGVKSYKSGISDVFLFMFGEIYALPKVTRFELKTQPMWQFHDFNMEGIHNKKEIMQQNVSLCFLNDKEIFKQISKISTYKPNMNEMVVGYIQWADIYEGVSLQVIHTSLTNYDITGRFDTNQSEVKMEFSVLSVKEHLLFTEDEIVVERMAAKLLGQEQNPFMKSENVEKRVKEILNAKN